MTNSIRVNFDPRAPRRFNVRALPITFAVPSRFAPMNIARLALMAYIAQAAGGAAVGFAIPFLRVAGLI